MHGLAQFEQDIVGHVNHRMEGSNTAALQPAGHPFGRPGRRIDALDNPTTVDRAGIWHLDVNGQGIGDGRRHWRAIDRLSRRARDRRHLAGSTLNR